jgi:hypothetical protein
MTITGKSCTCWPPTRVPEWQVGKHFVGVAGVRGPLLLAKRLKIARPSIGLDFTLAGSGDLSPGGLMAVVTLFFSVALDGRDFSSTPSLTSRARDSTILRSEAGMFVPVRFIVVPIGLLITVALHNCAEDRGRRRARLSEWLLR